MEIQDEDLTQPDESTGFYDEDLFNWVEPNTEQTTKERFSGDYSVLRQSLMSSSITKALFKIKYSVNKKLEGLESESYEDDGSMMTKKMMKELRRPNPDSFDMDIDDDLESEMLKYTSMNDSNGNVFPEFIDIDETEEYKPVLKEAIVMIRHSSIVINNEYELRLSSTVRSCVVLRGSKIENDVWDEDSLLMTLSSGYLLIVRLFLVERNVKPYVVQWWKTTSRMNHLPELGDVGKETLAHCSGSLIALTASQGTIRVHHCTQTPHGIMLDLLQNINFDGNLLHSCFLEPLKDASDNNQALIFSLVLTSHRRYIIRLFQFRLDEKHIMEHSPFLLTNEFDVPVFILPYKQGVLLMMENKVVILSVSQILSADYNFMTADFGGAFPTGYYKPKTNITTDQEEVLISTEDGTIYSVVAIQDKIHIKPILRVPRLSHFILEKIPEGFELHYTSSFGNGGCRVFPELLSDGINHKELLDMSEKVEEVNNWAPLIDVEVVGTRSRNQELWLAHGKCLSRVRHGHRASKEIQDHKLRKAYKLFSHSYDEDIYFIFSFVDKTLVYKYEQDHLIDVEDSGLDLVDRTITISSYDSVCFQILEDAIVVTDFASDQTMRKDLDDIVVLADCMGIYVALIIEDVGMEGESCNKMVIYESSSDIHMFGTALEIDPPPTFIKFFGVEEELFLVIGGSGIIKIFRRTDHSFEPELEVPISFSDPHDIAVCSTVLLVSSRFGELATYSLSIIDSELQITYNHTINLSESPIEFQIESKEFLLISKQLWKLPFNDKYPTPVIFNEQKERNVHSALKLNDRIYAVLRDDGFSLVNISNYARPILKSIKLSQVPKKVKYLSHLRIFAIISEYSLAFSNKFAQLETKLYSKRQQQALFEDEIPLSLSVWILPTAEKAFRNLLIGCKTATGGSIKVLQPKFAPNTTEIIEAFELYSAKTDAPVLAFEQLGDNTVIYSSGAKLFVSTYDLEQRKMSDTVVVHEFNTLIMSIDVQNSLVLVSTKDYSVAKFKSIDGKLTLSDNDFTVRKVTNSLALNDHVTITTDKLHCSITGIEYQDSRFKSYVPFVPKLKRCQLRPLWYEGEIPDRFIAYGIGGEIQLYTLLDKDLAQKLSNQYKQNVVPHSVTQKGLWDIDDDMWENDRNTNVVDGDRLVRAYSGELMDLLKAVYF